MEISSDIISRLQAAESLDVLKQIVSEMSVDVPGGKAGAVTLLYSGNLDPSGNGIHAWQSAERIGQEKV